MATRITMPKLGMEMTHGTIASWLYKEGQPISKGQVIFQIETEKITFDVEAPTSGVLQKIVVREGESVPVGGLVGVIGSEDEPMDEGALVQTVPPPDLCSMTNSGFPSSVPPDRQADRRQAARVIASPAARKMARENGIDLSTISGSGPQGRILERDILRAIPMDEGTKPTVPARVKQSDASRPVTRMRAIIAERLTHSWETPHIYLMTEADAGEMQSLRTELLQEFELQTGYRISYDDILIRLVALALERRPLLNATWKSDHISIPNEINVGLAVATEEGLVVPIIRDANKKPLIDIVRSRGALVSKVRNRKLALDDLKGGTFSISNLGMFDVEWFTAILNPPQTGILAVGKIKQVPIAAGGDVTIRPVIKFVLGVDHRVVDGATAAAFVNEIKQMVENPRQYVGTVLQ